MNLNETLSLLRKNLLDSIGKEPRNGYMRDYLVSEYYENWSNQNIDGLVRQQLRFDFEGGPLELSKTAAVHLAVDKMKEDLEELIQDGDVENYSDVLLHSLDGAKKRGRQPTHVYVPGAMIIQEYSSSREQYEYVVYTVLYLDWRENEEG